MKFSVARRPSPSQPAIAIVAVVCVLVAVLGCWLLRFERAVPDTPPSATASSAAHGDHAQLEHATAPTSHTAFKSAGLHRDRPPAPLRVIPASQTSPLSAPIVWSWPGGTCARAPAPDHSGQDLLTQFCITRQ
ncbi:hypothetical protein A5707_06195 [Mycobacterium kyorinense]|uniref:Lipoprotein LpqS n=1 Tax=Mycobacterium kyorinense TaxID=487514 RepID=A0A1A2YVC0_9MYCO|nr:hypothetical protein [Mycobacterium kyorinense]OBI42214.1 hypothetical protein A5707_06195 [Mycobacterium kyorinense]